MHPPLVFCLHCCCSDRTPRQKANRGIGFTLAHGSRLELVTVVTSWGQKLKRAGYMTSQLSAQRTNVLNAHVLRIFLPKRHGDRSHPSEFTGVTYKGLWGLCNILYWALHVDQNHCRCLAYPAKMVTGLRACISSPAVTTFSPGPPLPVTGWLESD